MIRRFFATRAQTIDADLAFLLVRLVCGLALMNFGWSKIQNPFGWMPGSSIPRVFQALAALSEFGGGLALILGLFTRLAAFGIACTMAVAVYMHLVVMGDPFVTKQGGGSYSPAAVYLTVAILFMVTGPGGLSLDRFVFKSRST